jgi:hypothetical protein
MTTARNAAESCAEATESVRLELARRGVAFTKAKEATTRCRAGLDRAEMQLAAAIGKAPPESAATTGGPATAPTDDEIVEAACRQDRGRSEDAYEACRELQYRALAALGSRTAENEMIDPGVFEGIREICTRLHFGDFVQRDACETDKMTAARLAVE